MEVHHTAVRVSDLEATKAFYEDGLGLEFSKEFTTGDGVRNYYVTGDNLETEIQFAYDPESDDEIEPGGIVHLALLVDDVSETLETLTERTDCEVLRGPITVDAVDARAVFVEDPDGYEVEIFAHLEE
ncbi:VOC family protein [Natronolimnobius sp. AArcel1]|uniref:VOC family protein n=1 Tax=Natronolimnobius sp. AArcel1 TaxID=1679093 RepID=UPI0013EDD5AC|nr:VOC family protein [Natronolimnobius sp. AArcel1]NGM69611.1 VOC family protein [Natronolimnobius sp. AArcel1]